RILCLLFVGSYADLTAATLPQQAVTVSGNITADNGVPLPGVSVLEEGTNNGTMTDFDGNYSLEVTQGATVVFSYLGMTTVEQTVTETATFDLSMESSQEALEEVVVVGYGTQTRR